MKNYFVSFVKSVPLAVMIIGVGYLLAYFILNDPQKLNTILFVLGSIPIVVFLPSRLFGYSRGVLFIPQMIYSEFRRTDDALEQKNYKNETSFQSITYIMAGVLTLLFSSIIHIKA